MIFKKINNKKWHDYYSESFILIPIKYFWKVDSKDWNKYKSCKNID